jgi:hypothetical protein
MRQFIRVSLSGILIVGLVICSPSLSNSWAEEPVEVTEESHCSSEFAEIATAEALVELGRKHKSPELLVAASILLARSPLPIADDEGVVLEKKESDKRKNANIEEILKEAKGMNPDDKTLGELIARTRDSLQEVSRSLTYDPALEAYRQAKFSLGAKQRKVVTKATNGKKVSASTSSPVGVGIIALDTTGNIKQGAKPIASGSKGVNNVSVPKTGSYGIVVESGATAVKSGTVAVSTK